MFECSLHLRASAPPRLRASAPPRLRASALAFLFTCVATPISADASSDGASALVTLDASHTILEGRVIDVTSGMGIPSDDPDDPPPIPVTYLHVEVERVFRGAAGAEVRLLLPGGVAEDGTIVSVVGTPSLKLDDHVLVGTHSASVVAHGEDVVLLKHWSSGVFVEDRAAGPVPVVRDGQARLLRHSWLPAGPGSVSAEVTGECPADGDDSLAALEPAASWSDLIAAVESLGVGR